MSGATERWVKRLNKLARRITETEMMIHPSAWPEQTRADVEAYRKLAAASPATPEGGGDDG